MTFLLGIDLGCTKFIVGVAGADGRVLAQRQEATHAERGAADGMSRICRAIDEVCAEAGVEPRAAAAIGIGAPGPLDRRCGILHDPPQLPWGEAPLAAVVSAHCGGAPVRIDNDCKVGGVGEHRMGAGRGASSMAYFGVGTGIGGCVIIDGRVQYGESDNASELGHLVVWLDGPPCGCGSRGCLEGISSGSGIERRARARAAAGDAPGLLERAGSVDAIDAALVARAAGEGDADAAVLWREGIRALGAGVASIMNALSPEVIVVGGGIPARNGEPYLEAVFEAARAMAFGPNETATRLAGAALDAQSVLLGAIELARDEAGSRQ